MSNLYKTYNANAESTVRVINSNTLVEEKLKELGMKRKQENGGFRGGLLAEEAQIEDESALLASEEAEKILADAKEKAEEMIQSAQSNADAVKEQARKDGYTAGFEEGREKAQQECEAVYQEKENQLKAQRKQLEQDYQNRFNDMEPKLLDVILTVFEKVFHIQFDDKKEILLYLIQNAISNIEGSKNFHIRVGEAQRLFLENHKEEIVERVGHGASLEILSDPSLEGNACIIETDSGIFDCSLGVQLENLIKDLRALSL